MDRKRCSLFVGLVGLLAFAGCSGKNSNGGSAGSDTTVAVQAATGETPSFSL